MLQLSSQTSSLVASDPTSLSLPLSCFRMHSRSCQWLPTSLCVSQSFLAKIHSKSYLLISRTQAVRLNRVWFPSTKTWN